MRTVRTVRAWLTAKRQAGAMRWARRGRFGRPARLIGPRRTRPAHEARALYEDYEAPAHGPSELKLLRRRIALRRHREAMRAELNTVRAELLRAELRALDDPTLFQQTLGTPRNTAPDQ
ncbi:hypothetical protein [Streptomyces sp. NPDC127033]|uniref:hypothetical protein n=1 Tax=Streptomyces sp. NPDC127033 TaxID=3347110 RepID=UPI0036677389